MECGPALAAGALSQRPCSPPAMAPWIHQEKRRGFYRWRAACPQPLAAQGECRPAGLCLGNVQRSNAAGFTPTCQRSAAVVHRLVHRSCGHRCPSGAAHATCSIPSSLAASLRLQASAWPADCSGLLSWDAVYRKCATRLQNASASIIGIGPELGRESERCCGLRNEINPRNRCRRREFKVRRRRPSKMTSTAPSSRTCNRVGVVVFTSRLPQEV